MTNFLLGLLAGAVMAAVATIAAVRDGDVQKRLGLFPTQLSLPPKPENCVVPSTGTPSSAAAQAGPLDILFDARRRLGPASRSVAPEPQKRAGSTLDGADRAGD